MSEKEIFNLTDEQVDKIVKFRKAQEGLKLLQKPEEPEYEETMKKDTVFYKVNLLGNLLFKTVEQATAIVSALKGKFDGAYFNSYGSDYPKLLSKSDSYTSREADLSISEEAHYSPAVAEAAQSIEKRNREAREKYDELNSEYEKYTEDIQWIIDEVWEKVFEVRRKYEKLARLQTDYSEYLVLANSDAKIATAFLTKANALSEEEIAIIKGEQIFKDQEESTEHEKDNQPLDK